MVKSLETGVTNCHYVEFFKDITLNPRIQSNLDDVVMC